MLPDAVVEDVTWQGPRSDILRKTQFRFVFFSPEYFSEVDELSYTELAGAEG